MSFSNRKDSTSSSSSTGKHAHKILWHIDLLLGNDNKTNNETTAIARQQHHKYVTVLEPLLGSGLHARMEVLLETVFSMGPL
jgi:hypothetical protein